MCSVRFLSYCSFGHFFFHRVKWKKNHTKFEWQRSECKNTKGNIGRRKDMKRNTNFYGFKVYPEKCFHFSFFSFERKKKWKNKKANKKWSQPPFEMLENSFVHSLTHSFISVIMSANSIRLVYLPAMNYERSEYIYKLSIKVDTEENDTQRTKNRIDAILCIHRT